MSALTTAVSECHPRRVLQPQGPVHNYRFTSDTRQTQTSLPGRRRGQKSIQNRPRRALTATRIETITSDGGGRRRRSRSSLWVVLSRTSPPKGRVVLLPPLLSPTRLLGIPLCPPKLRCPPPRVLQSLQRLHLALSRDQVLMHTWLPRLQAQLSRYDLP